MENEKTQLGDYHKFDKFDPVSTCYMDCGLNHINSLFRDMVLSDEMSETALFRVLLGIYTLRLHPILGEKFFWPTLYPKFYNSNVWKNNFDKNFLNGMLSFKPEPAMSWTHVMPFFDRHRRSCKSFEG